MIDESAKAEGVRWLIASSRRTGSANEQLLMSLVCPQSIAAVSWHCSAAGNPYLAFLGAGSRVICTEDSEMMITEAIAAGKPVLSVRPRGGVVEHDALFRQYAQQGLLSRQSTLDALESGCQWPKSGGASFDPDLSGLGAVLADALIKQNRHSG